MGYELAVEAVSDDLSRLTAEVTIGLISIAAIILALVSWMMVRAVLRAAEYEPAAMVTVALSVLTMSSLAGFIVTGSEVLGTVVATGVGALAGSVTSMFGKRKGKGNDDDPRSQQGPEDS